MSIRPSATRDACSRTDGRMSAAQVACIYAKGLADDVLPIGALFLFLGLLVARAHPI